MKNDEGRNTTLNGALAIFIDFRIDKYTHAPLLSPLSFFAIIVTVVVYLHVYYSRIYAPLNGQSLFTRYPIKHTLCVCCILQRAPISACVPYVYYTNLRARIIAWKDIELD